MKKKIILIDPPGQQKGINVGLAYLSAVLTLKDINHIVLDLNNFNYSDKDLFKIIYAHLPDLIGYSIKTATYYPAIELIEKLKKNYPHIVHFVGGPHITLFYKEFFNEIDSVEFGLIGDGEITIASLCDRNFEHKDQEGIAYKEDGKIRFIPPIISQNLDELPYPSFDNFFISPLERFSYPLVTSRGCPYNCTYCSVKYISGSKWRYRTPQHVFGELKNAKNKYYITSFEIIDDTFTQKTDRTMAICDLFIEDDIGLPWSCPNGIRADRMNAELAQRMKQSGCHTVMFGIESSDSEMFKSINKGEQLSDVIRAVKITKKAGLKVGGFFIIGLPGDSLEKTKKSLKFVQKMGLDLALFNILSPYPMTEIWDIIAKQGRFLKDYKHGRHFLGKPKPIFEYDNFSKEKMIDAYLYVHTYQDLFSFILSPEASLKKRIIQAIKYVWKYDKLKIIRYKSWKKIVLYILSNIIKNQ